MNVNYANSITVKIPALAHEIAKQFAEEQTNKPKYKSVYLNTLAVYTVAKLLEYLECSIDLETGESWNYVVRLFHDVADLVIPNVGKIECRPVLQNQTVINLPVEVQSDRIAYVFVQFDQDLTNVQLLGFIRSYDLIDTEKIDLNEEILEPIEDLALWLERIENAQEFIHDNSNDPVIAKVQKRLLLEDWGQIIAKLETVFFRIDPEYWYYDGGDILQEYAPRQLLTTQRQLVMKEKQEPEEENLRELAKQLLTKLAEVWQDSNMKENREN